jgi:hypothetical protein
MQPILISFSVILFGVVAAVLLFSVAMRGRGAEEESKPPPRAPTSSGNFFLDEGPGLSGLDEEAGKHGEV